MATNQVDRIVEELDAAMRDLRDAMRGIPIRRGSFTSVAHLQAAIQDYLSDHNANPKPFVWTKTADVILEKERRALDALEAVKGGYQALESEH